MVLKLNSSKILGIFLVLQLGITSSTTAKTLFEGYYKITMGTQHVGYSILRYEFDEKAKQFKAHYLTQTSPKIGGLTSAVKAVSDAKLKPIFFQYTGQAQGKTKTIDANFQKGMMNAVINTTGGKPQKINKALGDKVFLSIFLNYLMLNAGYKIGIKFSYSAIAEEWADLEKGEAYIKEESNYLGRKTFRVLNNFGKEKYISYVTPKGDVLGTSSPLQNISSQLVATPNEATKGIPFNASTVKALFGNVPKGKINLIAGAALTPPDPGTQTPEDKKQKKDGE